MSRKPGETQCEQSKLFGIVDLYRSYSLLVTFLAAFLLMINDVLLLVHIVSAVSDEAVCDNYSSE